MKPTFAFGLALLLVVAPATARAPTDQYDKFDKDSTTIKDNFTKLRWDRATTGPVNYAQARTSCVAPKRVPTMKELLTIIDEQPQPKYDQVAKQNFDQWVDRDAFGNFTPSDFPYWTSSPYSGADQWTVHFRTGETDNLGVGQSGYVRCVQTSP